MRRILLKFLQDEKAATAIEYSMILALIVLALIAALQVLGGSMDDMYNYVSSGVTGSLGG